MIVPDGKRRRSLFKCYEASAQITFTPTVATRFPLKLPSASRKAQPPESYRVKDDTTESAADKR
jgi:hypothetical protein